MNPIAVMIGLQSTSKLIGIPLLVLVLMMATVADSSNKVKRISWLLYAVFLVAYVLTAI